MEHYQRTANMMLCIGLWPTCFTLFDAAQTKAPEHEAKLECMIEKVYEAMKERKAMESLLPWWNSYHELDYTGEEVAEAGAGKDDATLAVSAELLMHPELRKGKRSVLNSFSEERKEEINRQLLVIAEGCKQKMELDRFIVQILAGEV
jgi:hypothetical protein